MNIPLDPQHTALAYVYKGELTFGLSGKILKAEQLGQLINGNNIHLITLNQSAQFLVLAAMPLNGPVVQSDPFVMNTMEEIEQAYRDYRDGVLTQ